MFFNQQSVDAFISNLNAKAPPIGPGDLFNGDHVPLVGARTSDPKITGYGVVSFLTLPPWLEQSFPWFREGFEKNILAFNGLEDQTLNTVEVQRGGFSGETEMIVTNILKGNKNPSVTHKEMAFNPYREVYKFWIYMINNPSTGTALYPTIDWGGRRYAFSERNHTGTLIYASLRPDVTNIDATDIELNSIQQAYMWTNVAPTIVSQSNDNFQSGSVESVDLEQTFKGNFANHISRNSAAQLLRDHSLIRDIRNGAAAYEPLDFQIGGLRQ